MVSHWRSWQLCQDGYIELKDRSKDIIISGGENISSIEIEKIIIKHPNVHDCAVIGIENQRYGRVPCAFIEKNNESLTKEEEIIKIL